MVANLVKIEEQMMKIWDDSTEKQDGKVWARIAEYVGIEILKARMEQELTPIALSDMQLALAKLEGPQNDSKAN